MISHPETLSQVIKKDIKTFTLSLLNEIKFAGSPVLRNAVSAARRYTAECAACCKAVGGARATPDNGAMK